MLCDIHLGQFLSRNGFTAVSLINVLQHDLHRRTVHDDMMVVEEEVIVVFIMHHMNMEQAASVNVKWLHKASFFLLDVLDFLDSERPGLVIHVKRLHGFAVIVQCDAREQRGVSLKSCFYSIK